MHFVTFKKFELGFVLCQQLGVENDDIISLPQLIPICYVDILYSSLMILQKFTKMKNKHTPK